MTAEDKAAIEAKAHERKLTVTDYLTRAGVGRAARQRSTSTRSTCCVPAWMAVEHGIAIRNVELRELKKQIQDESEALRSMARGTQANGDTSRPPAPGVSTDDNDIKALVGPRPESPRPSFAREHRRQALHGTRGR
ncbi:hypothetical protein BZM27_50925 [Paraburkholderia steynii]|uniref:Uncharacterized protein n=1 Tax=Paraburkholderia steynii TaxID=1245441 RepID=A0A4R0X8W4_9BURK|nr:hypothetical protein BZM27_50925 [Paraburkholderia steynii]